MKSLIKYLLSVLVVVSIIFGLNYIYPSHGNNINSRILDIMFSIRGDIGIKNNVTIIDIDNRSINTVGQWPWSRNTMAKLVQNLNKFKPSVIGFSIIFSEADRTSPSNFITDNTKVVENYDETFGLAIEDSDVPIVLGYNFLSTPSNIENHQVPYVPAVFKNKVSNDKIYFLEPQDALLNIPAIQDASYSSAFLNTIKDDNGRITAMPMIMKYKDTLLPSLPLELVRTIYSVREIYVENNKKLNNYIKIDDIKIPVDESSSLPLNYAKDYTNINHISAVDILNNDFNRFKKSYITGNIVLIGANATGMSQSISTPFNKDISILDVEALVIENILSNNYLITPYWIDTFNYIATIIIVMIILITIYKGTIALNITAALTLLVVWYFSFLYLFEEYGYVISNIYILEAIFLSFVVSIVGQFIRSKLEITNIRGKFASKVSKQVMDDLLDTSKRKGDLSSQRKKVTVFFSDIKSFTKITEKINDPHRLTLFINRYMDAMTKNIMLSEGTVDKFMGDAIMAYWNAPYEVENHTDKALTSAIEQISLLDEINEINLDEKLPIIKIRIGITFGEVFVGEVGGELRSDYTIMGKNVNHAAVLEQAGKYYNANIIISQSVRDNVKENYLMMLIDIMQVDGTSDAFNIYEVYSKDISNSFVNDAIQEFEKAVFYYRESNIDDAILIFRNLLVNENILNKKICAIYIKRCEDAYLKINKGMFNPIQSVDKSFISG